MHWFKHYYTCIIRSTYIHIEIYVRIHHTYQCVQCCLINHQSHHFLLTVSICYGGEDGTRWRPGCMYSRVPGSTSGRHFLRRNLPHDVGHFCGSWSWVHDHTGCMRPVNILYSTVSCLAIHAYNAIEPIMPYLATCPLF